MKMRTYRKCKQSCFLVGYSKAAKICFFCRKFRFHTKKRNLPILRFRKKILGKYARPCGLTPPARKLADSSSTDESTLDQQALQG
ncbi:hypothetical protein AVEN_47529-1 [Araneus ventricosus]|uniref:Uncharacterized protein n=1 Tax=Araneus ventricosus TaxID=182803 RepID=A0A4Y2TXB0_ARAVE|nr:hypothetical protein AVEN_47529-1 [Araneus ventricosus]